MKQYDHVLDACPACDVTIGERGVARMDTDRAGRVRYVEIECHCGHEWEEVLDPEERVEIRTNDHALDEFR